MMWLIIPVIILALIFAFLRTPAGIGMIGEHAVRFTIGKSKENQQYVINNYMLSVEGKSSQIDHIVIKPQGVFVIETKNYSGRIYGNESQQEWTQTLNYGKVKNKLYNPLKQNATHFYRLKSLLSEDTPLYSVVVFVRGNTQYLETDKVINHHQLRAVLNTPCNAVLSSAQMKNIYEKLVEAKESCTVTAHEHIREIQKMKEDINNNICPRCGANLLLRHGKNGDFYGCTNYPKCTFTKRV